MGVTSLAVGEVRCTRVSYAELDVDADVVGLSAEQVAGVAWAEPRWARDGRVRVAAAAWIVESGDACIVVDPLGAADAILREGDDAVAHQEAFAALLAEAGFPRERVTHAVATHLDGIGMLAWRADTAWEPFFPNASIHFARRELDAIDDGFEILGEPPSGAGALAELRVLGAVTPTDDGHRLAPGVVLEVTGAHNPGHQIVRIDSAGERAAMIGHLALSPLHLATGECRLHLDPVAAGRALAAVRDEGSLIMGPLWPEPGAGQWHDGTFHAWSG